MTEGWVRYLCLGAFFLGASFHRLFLYLLYSKVFKRVRHRELSVFLGLLSFSFLWFLFGIWDSFQQSFTWSGESAGELGLLLLIGIGFGILFSGAVSLHGKGKLIGIALVSGILLYPFLFLPRVFKGWIPVWESVELCSFEMIRPDREGTGLILSYPKKGAVYVYLPDRNVTLQIRQRILSIGYHLFALPPLYCKIESVGSYILKDNSNEANLSARVLQVLPKQKERMVSLSLETIKVFTPYAIRCNSNGEIQIVEK